MATDGSGQARWRLVSSRAASTQPTVPSPPQTSTRKQGTWEKRWNLCGRQYSATTSWLPRPERGYSFLPWAALSFSDVHLWPHRGLNDSSSPFRIPTLETGGGCSFHVPGKLTQEEGLRWLAQRPGADSAASGNCRAVPVP